MENELSILNNNFYINKYPYFDKKLNIKENLSKKFLSYLNNIGFNVEVLNKEYNFDERVIIYLEILLALNYDYSYLRKKVNIKKKSNVIFQPFISNSKKYQRIKSFNVVDLNFENFKNIIKSRSVVIKNNDSKMEILKDVFENSKLGYIHSEERSDIINPFYNLLKKEGLNVFFSRSANKSCNSISDFVVFTSVFYHLYIVDRFIFFNSLDNLMRLFFLYLLNVEIVFDILEIPFNKVFSHRSDNLLIFISSIRVLKGLFSRLVKDLNIQITLSYAQEILNDLFSHILNNKNYYRYKYIKFCFNDILFYFENTPESIDLNKFIEKNFDRYIYFSTFFKYRLNETISSKRYDKLKVEKKQVKKKSERNDL